MLKNNIRKNFERNLLHPELPGNKPILSQLELSHWHYGRYKSDYCGCSWVAIYNALYILGDYTPAPKIIRWMESRPLFTGIAFNGLLGGYPWTVAGYFKKRGYNVSYGLRNKTIEKKASKARATIVFYIRRDFSAHFVALSPVQANRYHFLNERQGVSDDIRSLDDFHNSIDSIFKWYIFIG